MEISIAVRTLSRTTLMILFCLEQSCSIVKEQEVNLFSPDITKAYVYECDDNFNFSAKFDDDKVQLFLPEKTINLKKIASASETFYNQGDWFFRSKTKHSELEIGQTIYQNCNNNPAKAVWETAKLNGVDFRAIGNEPNWILEIKEYSKTLFITEYGNQKFIFKSPHSIVDYFAKKTTYKTRSNEHALEILLEAKPCIDLISGEMFETSVFVGMDGLGYHGCGKALH